MLLCIFLLFLYPFARAQNKTVTGTVLDDKGVPLTGATVRVKGGSSSGVSSDAAGRFSLSVPVNATALVVSYVGFETQEVALRGGADLRIGLQAGHSSMDEAGGCGVWNAEAKGCDGGGLFGEGFGPKGSACDQYHCGIAGTGGRCGGHQ
ncbi:carboxypeptidase regulatory-like domain-containing protein [Puia sp. P3]|uniref:carboxypeptidase regulatory-like domain-containing protein n=1 Tax=Puia sp. P3 TaxID=3423952 RepID=UPI003D66EC20